MSERSDHQHAIHDVLARYAEALDTREWRLLDQVFTPDLVMDWGEWRQESREQAVASIRSYLDGCGPSQHLLGNHRVALAADCESATSRVYVRVMHLGRGSAEGRTYEMGGEYRDRLVRTPDGWRIAERRATSLWELGERAVLRPSGT